MSSSARPCFTLSFLNGGFRPVAQLCRGIGRAAIGPGWARSDLAADLVHIPSRRDSIETGKRANPSLKVRTSVKPPISKVKPDSPYMQEHAHPIHNHFTAKHASPY